MESVIDLTIESSGSVLVFGNRDDYRKLDRGKHLNNLNIPPYIWFDAS